MFYCQLRSSFFTLAFLLKHAMNIFHKTFFVFGSLKVLFLLVQFNVS